MNDIPMENIVDVYREMTARTTEVLFEKGRLLRKAIEAGADKDDLLKQVGKESGDSKALVNQIYAVAMVYPDHMIAHDFDWFTHMVTATAPDVNPHDYNTHVIAWRWMEAAIAGYKTERHLKSGKVVTVHRKHTARTLRKAIRAATGNGQAGKREVVYKGEGVIKSADEWTDILQLHLPTSELDMWALLQRCKAQGETVTVTITRTRQQAAETASEIVTQAEIERDMHGWRQAS